MRFITQDIETATAMEFLNEVSLRQRHFVLQGPRHWLFRGQARTWPMLPTAFRRDGRLSALNREREIPNTHRDQARLEKLVTKRFFDLADRIGLPLPEDSQALRRSLNDLTDEALLKWPEDNILALLGLAQHSGLPTRLLDWTWSPYVAAYFAAIDTVRDLNANPSVEIEDLVVVAWSPSVLDTPYNLGTDYPDDELQLVTVPATHNSNLKAQEGLFILSRPKPASLDAVFDPKPLEQILNSARPATDSASMIASKRIVLPRGEAQVLLYLLEQEGVSTAAMHPGYSGVVQQLMEHAQPGSG